MARYLRQTEKTLSRWRRRNLIPFLKIGQQIRYDGAAVLLALMSKNRGTKMQWSSAGPSLPPSAIELLREIIKPLIEAELHGKTL